MTKDDIILMAREAGLIDWFNSENDEYIDFANCLDKFAALVAAHEREACAKVCEQAGVEGYGTLAAAAMIRARGEK
jgi:hypothetical protein